MKEKFIHCEEYPEWEESITAKCPICHPELKAKKLQEAARNYSISGFNPGSIQEQKLQELYAKQMYLSPSSYALSTQQGAIQNLIRRGFFEEEK